MPRYFLVSFVGSPIDYLWSNYEGSRRDHAIGGTRLGTSVSPTILHFTKMSRYFRVCHLEVVRLSIYGLSNKRVNVVVP